MTDVGLGIWGGVVKEILFFAFAEFLPHFFQHQAETVLFPLVLVPRSASF